MLEWMLLPLKRYAEFSGRSRRKEYWSFALLNVIVYVALLAMMSVGGFSLSALMGAGGAMDSAFSPGPIVWLGLGLMGLWGLAMLLPSVAVVIRRLHDRDMSGWWYLGVIVASMIPVVGLLAGIAFLVLMFLEGTKGPNRFGPDPKGGEAG